MGDARAIHHAFSRQADARLNKHIQREINLMLIASTLAFMLSAAPADRPLTKVEMAVLEMEIKAKLKDPDSAKIEPLPYRGGIAVCGKVNAKNSYGGYTGFVPFSAMVRFNQPKPQVTFVMIGDPTDRMMNSIIISSCADNGYKIH
jgi:hypothetical protein